MEQREKGAIVFRILSNRISGLLNKYIIFKKERWVLFLITFLFFFLRVIYTQGYYAIAYILGFTYL